MYLSKLNSIESISFVKASTLLDAFFFPLMVLPSVKPLTPKKAPKQINNMPKIIKGIPKKDNTIPIPPRIPPKYILLILFLSFISKFLGILFC